VWERERKRERERERERERTMGGGERMREWEIGSTEIKL
jgi:hypothetical protein